MSTTILDQIFNGLSAQRPEFASAYDTWRTELEPALSAREDERKAIISRARNRTIQSALICGGIAIAVLIFLLKGQAFIFAIFGAVLGTAIMSGATWVPLFGMKSETKQLVVGAAAHAFGFKYDTLHPDVSGISDWKSASKFLSQKDKGFKLGEHEAAPTPAFDVLKQAKLLPGYDRRKFEDLIEGKRADTLFSMVECKLTEQQGSGKNRRTVTTFQGLLFHIQYPERFLGRTMIARRGWWKGWFGDDSLKKVDLVSKELRDSFTIYSNDQVEARALLTPDRMERLIALERHFKGGKLRGIFEGDHLTLALEADDQFEAGSIWKPLVDPQRYVSALTEIGLVCDVIDGFLTREWVKDKL